MAYLDDKCIFANDTAVAASVTTTAVDLGTKGPWIHPLFIQVGLSDGISVGAVTKIEVQTASDSVFTSPTTELEYLPASTGQGAPCTLAQFYAPIKTGNRYIRLKITAAAGVGETLTGGKIVAFMSPGLTIRA